MSVSQMRILGIDVAKAKLDIALLLPDGKFRSEVVPNTLEGFEKLAAWLARETGSSCRIEVIPGIAALNACAAVLGAPLMHDFAAVSLSDLMTPWPLIEKRLHAAAAADFVTVIYNPKSGRRASQIVRAREIMLEHRAPDTPAGIVTGAGRPHESVRLTTLAKMLDEEIGMQTTVIIGNSQTFVFQGKMVTPRGYADKYGLADAARS